MRAVGAALAAAVLAWLLSPEGPEYHTPYENLNPLQAMLPVEKVDVPQVTHQLTEALKFRTEGNESHPFFVDEVAGKEFKGLQQKLAELFPRLYELYPPQVFNEYSLLFTIPGLDASLRPALFISHNDVVPVPDEHAWKYPPFGGVVAEGKIWGRGAIDNKGSTIAMLHAIDFLISQKMDVEANRNQKGFWLPKRTMYLAFGHDEEFAGRRGAYSMFQFLSEKHGNNSFEAIFDEGIPATLPNYISGLNRTTAFICTTEKGDLSLQLTAKWDGGHSSDPPKNGGPIVVLSKALAKLHKEGYPPAVRAPASQFIDATAPHMKWPVSFIFSNRRIRLFNRIVTYFFSNLKSGSGLVKTTQAFTRANAGFKNNVLATEATATINMRILPGDTVDWAIERARKLVEEFEIVSVESLYPHRDRNPPPVSETNDDSLGWVASNRAIRGTFGDDVVIAAQLMVARTDSSHFLALAPTHIYRQSYMVATRETMLRFHNTDEWITPEDLAVMTATNAAIMQQM